MRSGWVPVQLIPLLLFSIAVQAGEPVDRIVAVVDETAILESQLQEELDVFRMEPSLQSLPPEEVREIALNKLVGDHLILAKAKLEDLVPTEDNVEEALETSIQRMRTQFPDEEAFQAALHSEGITVEELRGRYREEVEKTLTVRMVMDRLVRSNVDLSEQQVQEFYEGNQENLPTFPARYLLAQIFIEPEASEAGDASAREALLELKRRADSGEDFGELAGAHSEGPSASMGGDLGFFDRGDMVRSFSDAAFALEEPGDISDVVLTSFGLHIIQLVAVEGDRIRVRHILMTSDAGEGERDSARILAEAVRESVVTTGEFDRFASAYSDDPASSAKGGKIGTFATDDVSPQVNDALNRIPEGGISDVVEAEDGFHIFKLLGRYPAGKPTLEEAYEDIRAAAAQAKRQEAIEQYIEDLKKEIYVRVL